MKTATLKFDTANGATNAFVALPDNKDNSTKSVILIHEWWGLNDHIRDIAGRYANEGFIAIAPDLYRGNLATNPDEAAKLMADLQIEDGLNTIKNTIDKAQETYRISSFGISGYCMGGTYSLRATCEIEGINAAAPILWRCSTGRNFAEAKSAGFIHLRNKRRVDKSRKSRRINIGSRKV